MKKLSQKQKEALLARKVYLFEHPYCEVCGEKAVHTHEIIFRSQGGKCEPENEIALCSRCHRRAHFLEQPYLILIREDLWKIKGLDLDKMREKLRLAKSGCKK